MLIKNRVKYVLLKEEEKVKKKLIIINYFFKTLSPLILVVSGLNVLKNKSLEREIVLYMSSKETSVKLSVLGVPVVSSIAVFSSFL